MAKREQHRQGVVYGPVRPSGRRDRGAIMGSLLGVLVVVGTVVLLGYGLMLVLQGRGASPSSASPTPHVLATPTLVAPASVAPSLAPTATPTGPAATPSATAEPTSAITPAPTIFVPQVLVGPGYVTFGTESDAQLLITDARATFSRDERMVWSAQLTERADSVDLRIQILKLDPQSPGGQRVVREDEVRPRVQDGHTFLRRVRVANVTEGPGLYTVRYVRGDQILSEGSFLVPET